MIMMIENCLDPERSQGEPGERDQIGKQSGGQVSSQENAQHELQPGQSSGSHKAKSQT